MFPFEKVDEYDIDRLRSVITTSKSCSLNDEKAYGLIIEDSKVLVLTGDNHFPVALPNLDDFMSISHLLSGGGFVFSVVESFKNVIHYTIHTYIPEYSAANVYSMTLAHSIKVDFKPSCLRILGEQEELFLCVSGSDSNFHLFEVTKSGALQSNRHSDGLRAFWNQKMVNSLTASAVIVDMLFQIHPAQAPGSQHSYHLIVTYSNGYRLTNLAQGMTDKDTVTMEGSAAGTEGPAAGVLEGPVVRKLSRSRGHTDTAYQLLHSVPSATIFLPNHKGLAEHMLVGLCSGELGIVDIIHAQLQGQQQRDDCGFVQVPISALLKQYSSDGSAGASLLIPDGLGAITALLALRRTECSNYSVDVAVGYSSGVVCLLNLSYSGDGAVVGDMSGSLIIADNIDIENDTMDGASSGKFQWSFALQFATVLPQKVVKLNQMSTDAGCWGSHVVVSTSNGVHIYRYSD